MSISTTRPLSLPPLRHVLVVGGGGREQALAWALRRCPEIEDIWISPGNAGTGDLKAALHWRSQKQTMKAWLQRVATMPSI